MYFFFFFAATDVFHEVEAVHLGHVFVVTYIPNDFETVHVGQDSTNIPGFQQKKTMK